MVQRTRPAIAAGLAFVAVLSLAAVPVAALIIPALAVAVLLAVPARERALATTSARMRAVVIPTTSDQLLAMALGAAIGLAYLLAVLQL
jgi:hypothetical protein